MLTSRRIRFAKWRPRPTLAGMSSRLEALPPLASPAPASERRAREGQALMIGGGLLLGTIGLFVEEAGQDPATTVWFRCAFGLAALLAWGTARGRLGELAALRGRALAAVLGAGALMVLNWALFFAAIPRCSIAVSTVVFHLQPFWLMAMGAAWLRERVSPGQWAAAGVALVGLALASGLLGHDAAWWAARSGYATGLLMCVVGSLCYAGAGFIAKCQGDRVGSFALSAGQCAVGTLAFAAWPLLHGLPDFGPAWGWLAGLGVLHTGLAYVLLYAGMSRMPTGRIAVLQFVYPLTAVMLDWAVYGRALGTLQWTGVVLIGAALWSLKRARPPGRR